MAITLADLLTAVHTGAADSNLDTLREAVTERKAIVGRITAATLQVGDRIVLRNISPKSLAGATGVVVRTELVKGKYIGIRFDHETEQTLVHLGRRWNPYAGETGMVLNVHYSTVAKREF